MNAETTADDVERMLGESPVGSIIAVWADGTVTSRREHSPDRIAIARPGRPVLTVRRGSMTRVRIVEKLQAASDSLAHWPAHVRGS